MRAKNGKKDETWYRNTRVIPILRTWGFDVQHHEDKFQPDIPDLSIARDGWDGWIELKFSEAFPTRGKFNPPDFTAGQRAWLSARAKKGGGNCWLLWGSLSCHVLLAESRFTSIGDPWAIVDKQFNDHVGMHRYTSLDSLIGRVLTRQR